MKITISYPWIKNRNATAFLFYSVGAGVLDAPRAGMETRPYNVILNAVKDLSTPMAQSNVGASIARPPIQSVMNSHHSVCRANNPPSFIQKIYFTQPSAGAIITIEYYGLRPVKWGGFYYGIRRKNLPLAYGAKRIYAACGCRLLVQRLPFLRSFQASQVPRIASRSD